MTTSPRRPPIFPGRAPASPGAATTRRAVLSMVVAALAGTTSGCAFLPAAPGGGQEEAGTEPDRPVFDGPFIITQDDMVIQGMTIPQPLVVMANDVVVRDCLVQAATDTTKEEPLILVPQGFAGTVLEGNQLRGPDPGRAARAASGVKLYGSDAVLVGNDVSRIAGKAVVLGGPGVQVRNNHVHDFVARRGATYGGIVWDANVAHGAVTISGNELELWPATSTSALIALPDAADQLLVTQNWLAGGVYALLGGGEGVTVTRNQFSTKFAPTCGKLGMHGYLGDHFPKGLTWTANAWADGPDAGDVVEP